MNFSKADFINEYTTETKEHLDAINSLIPLINQEKINEENFREVLRHLHTVKGTSRMLDFSNIETLAHNLEDIYKNIQDDKLNFTDSIITLTFRITETIQNLLNQVTETLNDEINISKIETLFKNIFHGQIYSPEEIELFFSNDNDSKDELETEIDFNNITSIRIELSRINEIVRSFDNLIIRQFKMKKQIEELEAKLGKINQHIPNQLKEDMLLSESFLLETQRQVMNLRMIPLDLILNPLKKEIKSDSILLNKKIHIDIPQTNLMLDKIILEQLQIILIHLVRNSMDHGIEKEGTISIQAEQIANHIKISIKDDGRGIDYEKIRQRVLELNPLKEKEIQSLKEIDLQQYIFQPGFTTSSNTTKLSGRGMGLDIVRTCMEKIKGKTSIISEKGEGTTFELNIPISLASQRGVFVYVGNRKIMIPSHYINEILISVNDVIITIQAQKFILIRNKLIPLYYLSTLFNETRRTDDLSIIILEYIDTFIAIVVDSVEQNENVVVNALPPLMSKMVSLQGVVYDEDYSIVPILNIPFLMKTMRELVSYDTKKYETKTKKKIHKILIVDDSITTLQIEEAIFETSGYKTTTAEDGIEAIEKLKQVQFDAIVTDINMPRMDGMTLLANIRRMASYVETPVIIVSGAYDEKERNKFIDAGANAFIVKSDFQRGNLIDCVQELLNGK